MPVPATENPTYWQPAASPMRTFAPMSILMDFALAARIPVELVSAWMRKRALHTGERERERERVS